jgi:hypothetical protein
VCFKLWLKMLLTFWTVSSLDVLCTWRKTMSAICPCNCYVFPADP